MFFDPQLFFTNQSYLYHLLLNYLEMFSDSILQRNVYVNVCLLEAIHQTSAFIKSVILYYMEQLKKVMQVRVKND
jgi:hypothetical protein